MSHNASSRPESDALSSAIEAARQHPESTKTWDLVEELVDDVQRPSDVRELFTALNALRQWGDQYLSEKPMRLLRRKHDRTPVIAALVPEGSPVLAADEIELVPGPGFPRHTR